MLVGVNLGWESMCGVGPTGPAVPLLSLTGECSCTASTNHSRQNTGSTAAQHARVTHLNQSVPVLTCLTAQIYLYIYLNLMSHIPERVTNLTGTGLMRLPVKEKALVWTCPHIDLCTYTQCPCAHHMFTYSSTQLVHLLNCQPAQLSTCSTGHMRTCSTAQLLDCSTAQLYVVRSTVSSVHHHHHPRAHPLNWSPAQVILRIYTITRSNSGPLNP